MSKNIFPSSCKWQWIEVISGRGEGRAEKLITFLLWERMACSCEVKRILTTRICFKNSTQTFPHRCSAQVFDSSQANATVSSFIWNLLTTNYTKYEGRFRFVIFNFARALLKTKTKIMALLKLKYFLSINNKSTILKTVLSMTTPLKIIPPPTCSNGHFLFLHL